jgi:hypothetical protein
MGFGSSHERSRFERLPINTFGNSAFIDTTTFLNPFTFTRRIQMDLEMPESGSEETMTSSFRADENSRGS